MFKNNVFNVNVDTKKWMMGATVRAIKTVCQTAVSIIGATTVIGEVDWRMVVSASVLSGIVSVLTSVAGIPEVRENDGTYH